MPPPRKAYAGQKRFPWRKIGSGIKTGYHVVSKVRDETAKWVRFGATLASLGILPVGGDTTYYNLANPVGSRLFDAESGRFGSTGPRTPSISDIGSPTATQLYSPWRFKARGAVIRRRHR